MSIFNKNTVKNIETTAANLCEGMVESRRNGEMVVVTRSQILKAACPELEGLDEQVCGHLFNTLQHLGHLNAFEAKRGRHGGVLPVGYEAPGAASKEAAKAEREAAKAEKEAEKARLKAEKEAEKARLKAEKEAEKARLKAEKEAEKARLKAEKEAPVVTEAEAEVEVEAEAEAAAV